MSAGQSKVPAQSEAAPTDAFEYAPLDEYDTWYQDDLRGDIQFERSFRKLAVTKPASAKPANATHRFKPRIVEAASEHAVMNNLLCAEELDPSGPLPPISQTVVMFQAVVTAIAANSDLTPYKQNIKQIVSNQPEKNELVHGYHTQIAHEKLANLEVIEAHAINHLMRASKRDRLESTEALVLWRDARAQAKEVREQLKHDKAIDGAAVVEKIDYARHQVERDVAQKWEGTTPQGRELIRKKLWTLERQLELEAGIKPPGIQPPEPPPDDMEPENPPPIAPVTAAHPV